METQEYILLEKLLGKLSIELGSKDFCITNGAVQDGYHIGVYKGANYKGQSPLEKDAMSYDIKSTVEKLKTINPK